MTGVLRIRGNLDTKTGKRENEDMGGLHVQLKAEVGVMPPQASNAKDGRNHQNLGEWLGEVPRLLRRNHTCGCLDLADLQNPERIDVCHLKHLPVALCHGGPRGQTQHGSQGNELPPKYDNLHKAQLGVSHAVKRKIQNETNFRKKEKRKASGSGADNAFLDLMLKAPSIKGKMIK